MPAGVYRTNIAGLVPDEAYAIQARAINNGHHSPWSNKVNFATVDDIHQGGPVGGVITAPETPTLISWSTSNAGYTAVWSPIMIMANGAPTAIVHYDMELTSSVTATTVIYKYYTNSKVTISYTLPLGAMKSLFGGNNPGDVTLRVRAVNSANTVSEWSNSLVCSMGTPDPPTNAVVVEAIDQIRISWTPPVNKNFLDGYRVYTGATAGFTPGPGNLIYEGAAPTFAYTTTTYSLQYFKIRSYSFGGTESIDLPCSGTPKSPFTLDVAPPGVPTLAGSLSLAGTLPRFANLTWTFNAGTPGNEDVAGFVIAWRKVGATAWLQDFASVELRALDIELPLPYADYEFKIASYDKVGNYSAYSTPVLSLGGAIPGAPAQVTGVASTASLDTFRITWTPNTEADVVNGGHYDVDIATNSGFTTGLQSYSTGNTFIEIGGLLPGTTYYYRVRAEDVGGLTGIYSATGNRTTPDYAPTKSDGAAPSSSPAVTLVNGVGYITALWNRITNNDLVTYEVHISTNNNFTPGAGTLLTETTGTSTIIRTTAAKVALSYGILYFVKVIAKDADGAAAPGTQASGTIAQAVNADIADVSFGKVIAGTVTSSTLVLGAGGIFRTNNSDVIITDTGITVGANSQISAAAMQAGTAFVDDLTISSNFTIGTSGVMKSANYAAGTTGWQLTNTAFDMRSGTVAAGTLVAGTITSSGIVIGASGAITVDSTGVIKSNNYAVNTTGWQISATGIQMNDANSTISVASLKTGTMASTTFTVGSGGAIRSANWNGTSTGFSISDTGLTMYTGTIQGAAVYTNQLASLGTDPNSPLPPIPGQSQGASFGINASGKAVFSGALIYGNTVLGNSTSHQVASGNYIAGTSGWLIRGDGYSEFMSTKINGNSTVGGTLSSISIDAAGGIGWALYSNGTASIYGGSIELGTNTGGKVLLANLSGKGTLRFYAPGVGIGGSPFSSVSADGEEMHIRGAFGGAVDLNNWLSTPWGGVNNGVRIATNGYVTNALYVGAGMQIGGGVTIANHVQANHTMTVQNQFIVNGNGNFNSIGVTNGIQVNGNITVNGTGWFGAVSSPELHGDTRMMWMNGTGGARYTHVGDSGRLSRGAQVPSSIRYKKNVTDLTYTKEQILSLRPVHYQNKFQEIQDEPRYAGFIAEEVAAAGLSDFVTYARVTPGGGVYNNPEVEGFDYSHFTAALLKVAQEQQAEIDDLRTRLELLEA